MVVGAATRDVDAIDPRGWRLGGTVTYAALAAARLVVGVRALIGVDDVTADADEIQLLRDAGVDVRLVRLDRGPVFDNRQTGARREQVAIQASDQLRAEALPADWRTPTAAILGPVADEMGDGWVGAFAEGVFVGLAWQGLLRRLTPRSPVERLPMRRTPLVARADALLASAEDVAGVAPLSELIRPNQELVVTHGERGALWLTVDGSASVRGRFLPPAPRRQPLDTTGAGDVFLAAWVAARTQLPDAPGWKPLLVASVMASLSVQRRRLADMPTRADLCQELVKLRDRGRG